MTVSRAVREPVVAGTFYPSHPRALRRDVEVMLEEAADRLPEWRGAIVGAVVPHAGYPYSGPTAAVAYKALASRNFETAILVGPSHREYFGSSSIFPGDAMATPLGEVVVDKDLAREIVARSDGLIASHAGHREEHALEVQLPFLQVIRPTARVVAITMGDQAPDRCAELAGALSAVVADRNVVLIASSDLSHYHPSPEAIRLDGLVVQQIRAFRPDLLLDDLEHDRVEACGGGPIVAVMMAARALGASSAVILHVCNSGDITGDLSSVVGYMSAILTTP
ncbi:MAG: AmmeMemoRadiSam system protein B [Bacteroidota bacterium]